MTENARSVTTENTLILKYLCNENWCMKNLLISHLIFNPCPCVVSDQVFFEFPQKPKVIIYVRSWLPTFENQAV